MAKIILLTSPRMDCRWLAHKLGQSVDLNMVVFEDKRLPFGKKLKAAGQRAAEYLPLTLLPWKWGRLWTRYKLLRTEQRVLREVLMSVPLEDRKLARSDLPMPTRTFTNLNSPEAVAFLRMIKPDLILTFNISVLKPEVIGIPPLGILNAHPALLPAYRGTMTMFMQLYNKDYSKTGVTVHFIDAEVDTGDIVLQRAVPSGPADTPMMLHYRNLPVVAELLAEAATKVVAGTAPRTPQEKSDLPTYRRRDVSPEMRAKLYRRLGQM